MALQRLLAAGLYALGYDSWKLTAACVSCQLSYKEGLTAVFFEGIVFFILAVTGIRGAVIKLVPR